jgi:hypothetical protein
VACYVLPVRPTLSWRTMTGAVPSPRWPCRADLRPPAATEDVVEFAPHARMGRGGHPQAGPAVRDRKHVLRCAATPSWAFG